MNIKNSINNGSKLLKENNIISHFIDSEILMTKALNQNREYVLLNLEKDLKEKELNAYNQLISQRSLGKPVAYLTGNKDFWKYEFKVSEDVLIPRPDTELIIESVLNLTKNKSKLKILDIGSGSGCIILTILKEKLDFNGCGIDLSKKCVNISKLNAINLDLQNRVKFFNSDVDNFNYGKYDLIISNPPYINKLHLKYLERDIIDHEPVLALDGGLDGISEIRKVINKSSELIKINGKLILEIAFNQKNCVKKLLREKGFYINNVLKDYAKNDRCIISTKI
jgi:release factor glutamine methyltransferase